MARARNVTVAALQVAVPASVVLLLAVLLLALASTAPAAPLERDEVPEPLVPWVDWVLRGHEQELCPFLHARSERPCVWPTRLDLDLDEKGGGFSQRWRIHNRAWVPLPGDASHWPQEVRVDGTVAPLAPLEGRPGIRLEVGDHRVEGRFRWDALPELIAIPPETGLLGVTLLGEPVAFPRRDERGRLWLRAASGAKQPEESRVEVEVHRRVVDEVPLRMATRIELSVSGGAREVVLGRVLPEGFVAMALQAPLPARIDPDGRLRVQVRAGRWSLRLDARHEGPAAELRLSDPGGPWDAEEIWVFQARPALRRVEVGGAPSVDPQQTTLPSEWRSLPAYLMRPGAALVLEEKRRGDAEPAPDQLALERSWWLDFDARDYTVTDRIQGVVSRSSRLEMGGSTELGRVSVNGEAQVISRIGDGGAGVEVQPGAIDLSADSRVPGRTRRIPVVGWDNDFQQVSGRLNLPPGWRLLHASGVDRASPTWTGRWTLLDLFVVLVAAMAFFRLFGPGWGALALVGLTLSSPESGAPRWVWLAVLTGEALGRAGLDGRFEQAVRIFRGAALLVLALVLIPFAGTQIRNALFPVLERGWSGAAAQKTVQDEVSTFAEPASEADAIVEPEARRERVGRLESSRAYPKAPRASSPSPYARYAPDPRAVIPTGPGLPDWSWEQVRLEWRGPVERDQQLDLLLLPPWAERVLAALRVALLVALLWGVLRAARSPGGAPRSATASLAVLLLAAAALGSAPARADIPPQALLDELRGRLLEAPVCHPHCASISLLRLDVARDRLRARLQVDVAAQTAVPVPGSARDWVPETVVADGVPAGGLTRRAGGVLFVQLGPGRHQLVLDGPLPDRDSVELPLPLKPHRIEARVEGWSLHGLHEDGRSDDNLQLSRLREASESRGAPLEPASLPAFVRVERDLDLDLRWRLSTSVVRLTPADTTLVLEVPLLAGESITTDGLRVRDGFALVSMGPGVDRVHWESQLETRDRIDLHAPDAVPWIEVWRLRVRPVWHVEATGIPVVHRPGDALREWRPWPGENVAVSVRRPEALAGATLTVDRSELAVTPGLRATDATLSLRLRSSQGGQHAIRLPENSTLLSVTLDGVLQPIRQEGRVVSLPLTPGTRAVEIAWREPRGIALRWAGPEVDLGSSSVNSTVRFEIPRDRWTLLAGGPTLGPAVLFWPLLAVVALVAWGLSKIPYTPLRWRHWLLLGLGLTQVPLENAFVVAGWLVALGWRRERGGRVSGRWFNLMQLALALWTLVALVGLFWSVRQGLLGLPEMQVGGNGSTSHLFRWYQDRSGPVLPQPWFLSVSLLLYRGVMLAWALWLAQALLGWLRWGWESFNRDEIWRAWRTQPPPTHVQDPIEVK